MMQTTILTVNPYLKDFQEDLKNENPDLATLCKVISYVASVQNKAVFHNISRNNFLKETESPKDKKSEILDQIQKMKKDMGFGNSDDNLSFSEV